MLAAARDMLLMELEKLIALKGPLPPLYHCGGSRYMSRNAFAHRSATPNAIANGRYCSNKAGEVIIRL